MSRTAEPGELVGSQTTKSGISVTSTGSVIVPASVPTASGWPSATPTDAAVAAWRAWLRRRDIPLFAWSSQARGFFTDRAGRDRQDDPDLVHGWYSETNFARRERAMALARRLGKSPLQVALAYCLHQDFPVIPLIGPLALGELEDSLKALDIALTPEDVRWLEAG